jgi:hypothetical protein
MKIIYSLLVLFGNLNAMYAQTTPPGIPYQAIARNANGTPYVNANLTVRFSLHEQTATGTVSYAETKSLQTNDLGLFSTTFGGGIPITGTFAGINWAQTTKFLQVEINLGSAWVDMGTQQLMSVPYAMYSGTASTLSSSSTQSPIGSGFTTISNGTFNGSLMQSFNYCFNLVESGYSDWRLPNSEEVFNYITLNGLDGSNFFLLTTTFDWFNGSSLSRGINQNISGYTTRCVR